MDFLGQYTAPVSRACYRIADKNPQRRRRAGDPTTRDPTAPLSLSFCICNESQSIVICECPEPPAINATTPVTPTLTVTNAATTSPQITTDYMSPTTTLSPNPKRTATKPTEVKTNRVMTMSTPDDDDDDSSSEEDDSSSFQIPFDMQCHTLLSTRYFREPTKIILINVIGFPSLATPPSHPETY